VVLGLKSTVTQVPVTVDDLSWSDRLGRFTGFDNSGRKDALVG
jgi:hypothetical protein